MLIDKKKVSEQFERNEEKGNFTLNKREKERSTPCISIQMTRSIYVPSYFLTRCHGRSFEKDDSNIQVVDGAVFVVVLAIVKPS